VPDCVEGHVAPADDDFLYVFDRIAGNDHSAGDLTRPLFALAGDGGPRRGDLLPGGQYFRGHSLHQDPVFTEISAWPCAAFRPFQDFKADAAAIEFLPRVGAV
jgi:hypothetical protein